MPELLKIVSSALGQDITDITISKGGSTLAIKTIKEIARISGVTMTMTDYPPPNGKIPVIKALREVIPGLGLAEAKAISENWPMWIKAVQYWGKYPVIETAYPFKFRIN
jgi:hypothetical protein